MSNAPLERIVQRVRCWRGLPIKRWKWRGSQVRPNYWLDVLVWWLAPLHWSQCCAEHKEDYGRIIAYCMRRKGHPAKHTTNDGMRF